MKRLGSMRLWKTAIVLLLFFPASLSAQAVEERVTPAGTTRYLMENARQIVQAGKDTTLGVFVAGCDQWAYYVYYNAINDSTNVRVHLDLSPDNQTFVAWSAGALDSAIVSGTASTTRLTNFTNPPNYAMYARLRLTGAMAAGDTVKVTAKFVLTWLPVALNP